MSRLDRLMLAGLAAACVVLVGALIALGYHVAALDDDTMPVVITDPSPRSVP